MIWNLRIRGPKGEIHAVQFDENSTLQALKEYAKHALEIAADDVIQLSIGFPPVVLQECSEKATVSDVLKDHDTIIVSLGNGSCNKSHVMVKDRKRTSDKKLGCHTLHQAKSSKTFKGKLPRGRGNRLGTEADAEAKLIQPSEDHAKAGVRCKKAISLSSKADVEEKLIEAVSYDGTKDLTSRFLHTATQKAVDYQYQVSLANARLSAAFSNKFSVTMLRNSSEDSTAEMRVMFKEGVRKWIEEIVTMLQAVQLRAVLKYILLSCGEAGKEMLKPFNMAQCSPRVFWNIARLYNGDVAAGLAALLPDEDWSFLEVRARKLSEKAIRAKANELHWKSYKKQKLQAESPERKENPCSQHSDAPTDSKLQQRNEDVKLQKAMRNTIACAAQKRMEDSIILSKGASAGEDNRTKPKNEYENAWSQPNDTKMEEKITVYCDNCDKARIIANDQKEVANVDEEHWNCEKLRAIGREGGCEAADDEIVHITGTKHASLLKKASINTRLQLASSGKSDIIGGLPRRAVCEINLLEINDYIEQARMEEIADKMAAIVGSSSLLSYLEYEKLGTPVEILKTPSDLILGSLSKHETQNITIEDVDSWKDSAQALLKQYSWMQEWRTN